MPDIKVLAIIRLLREKQPTEQNDLPYGSQCLVKKGLHNDVYVQVNRHKGSPKWHYIYRAHKDSSIEDIECRIKGELGLYFYD